MKRIMFTMTLLLSGLIFLGQTYSVHLSGGVFDEESGDPMVQVPVWISSDSLNDFMYFNTVFTGGEGYFEDTFDVPVGVEGTLYVSTPNCDGTTITETVDFSENNNELEVNFFVCGDPAGGDCEAMFYYYPEANDRMTLQFTDISIGYPTNWDWDFGDGDTSTEQNPLHTFSDIGQYMVTLTISDDSADCLSSIQLPVYVGDSIWIPDSCMAWFYTYPDSADYLTMHFNDMSIGGGNVPPTNWNWEFGDGTTSNEQNPVHTYVQEGDYEVCLTISFGDVCESTYCENIEVIDWDEYCEAQFYYYPVYDSMPNGGSLAIQFIDFSFGDPTSWDWDFGDEGTSGEKDPIHIYDEEGFYEVCLTIANPADSCESTYCQEVYVFDDSVSYCTAWFEYEVDELTVDFTGYLESRQTAVYSWDFGDGSTGTGQQVSYTYAEEGIYYVMMEVYDSLNDCFSFYDEMIWVGDVNFEVDGYVYLEDSMMADYADVYLMTFDTVGNNLITVATTGIDENGYYLFEEVAIENCIYFVQAELADASAWVGDYVPTYHVSALNWEDAWPIFPYPVGYIYNVFMLPAQGVNSGPGTITGQVTGEGGRAVLEDVEMLLLDESGTPFTYRRTSPAGDFDFPELSYGTYVVYTEIVGIQTMPVTIELTEENQEVNINIVVTNGEAVLGIGDRYSAFIDVIGNVYPNPITHNASINVTMKQEATVRLAIMNNYGQIISVYENSLSAGTHKLNLATDQLPKGIYFVSIRADDGIAMVKKLVKL